MSLRAIRTAEDDGFTLVELMVSAMLTLLVLLVVGGIFLAMATTQKSVTTSTAATASGQAAARSIVDGLTNAQPMSIAYVAIPFTLTTPVGDDQLLIARVLGSGTTVSSRCAAWYYSASTKSIRSTSSASSIAAPTPSALSGWTLLASGVTPVSGASIFSTDGTNALRLSIAFRVAASQNSAVTFRTSAVSQTGTTGGATCL